MPKDNTKWVKPARLLSVDMSDRVKIFHNEVWKIMTPQQFREKFYTDPGQWNKFFYQLYDKNHIFISTK